MQEKAQELVNEQFYPYSTDAIVEALQAANRVYLSVGITSQAEAGKQFPRPDHRHRIEHCGVVNPAILHRIEKLKMIPVPQRHFIGELGADPTAGR